MANAKVLDLIEWADEKTGIKMFGTVRKVMEKSVIVDLTGTDDATVISHKCYRIISKDEIKEDATNRFP